MRYRLLASGMALVGLAVSVLPPVLRPLLNLLQLRHVLLRPSMTRTTLPAFGTCAPPRLLGVTSGALLAPKSHP